MNAATQNGRLSIQLGVTTLSSLIFSSSVRANGGKTTIEDIVVQIPFPRGTNVVNDFRVNMGTVVYDEVLKVAKWSVISSLDTTTSGSGATSVMLPATFACKFTMSTGSSVAATSMAADAIAPFPYIEMSARRRKICERYQRKVQKQQRQQRLTNNWLVSPPNIGVSWKIPLASVSGIAVSGLSVMGEAYRPYKGVRNITQAGIYQVRCT
jgi:AP-3 complex subunit mu